MLRVFEISSQVTPRDRLVRRWVRQNQPLRVSHPPGPSTTGLTSCRLPQRALSLSGLIYAVYFRHASRPIIPIITQIYSGIFICQHTRAREKFIVPLDLPSTDPFKKLKKSFCFFCPHFINVPGLIIRIRYFLLSRDML